MAEREWREASDMRQSTLTLVAILAVAAVLRFWGLGAGLPHAPGIDEPEIMNRAVGMMKSGDFHPHFFDYPTLYIYVQLIVSTVQFLLGATAGTWRSLADVGPVDFYLWGRAVTATLGVLTVLLVYVAGMRWGTRHALFAATLMAVIPLHVRESHYVLTDVPVTFFVALAFVLTLRASEHQRAMSFAWAGAAAGLAAATKYTGGIVLVLPLLAAWMSPGTKPSRLSAALGVLGGCLAGYLLAAPYTVLDLPAFLNGYAKLAGSYAGGSPEPGWPISFKHLQNSLKWPATIAVLSGLVFGIVRAIRGPGRVRWTIAVVFPVLYFWFVSRQALIFGRYLLPLLPFVCVLAGAAVVSGVSLLRRYEIPRRPRTLLITALTVLTLLPPAIESVKWNRMISRTGTVDLAYRWITEHVPQGASVTMECKRFDLPSDRYRIATVRQLRERDYAYYVDTDVDYLVASSQCYGPYFTNPQNHVAEYAEYMRIFEQSRELVRFTPTAEHPGPELRVFRVRSSKP
ncbi:MAG: phospholipid carrier-dependent glycosyltransferase [Acidobacteria bacterium]|nr:phospholipid carrier-dependent glycosyltransferase [Acidobacteriota bacterium]MBA3887173.1 phospholipid carrier-dependent glycosyltransferase [Acidobacteriota bacterium]